jgi:ubiquinone/menaquinone biosynthesis C-methylase UbiE
MEGWEGWDDYAPFYDWENARTLGRRDVPFWQRLARQGMASRRSARPAVLELGCGTGRVTFPLWRSGVSIVGIDRSAAMLARAEKRRRTAIRRRAGITKARSSATRPSVQFVRGDIRHLPFPDGSFPLVIAPYGILQSLLRERDLAETLDAVARVVQPGGTFGLELVADLPSWQEYSRRVSLSGRRRNGVTIKLIESVRQDPQRRLTLFDQEFVERQGRQVQRRQFTLSFRTLTVRQMRRRLEKAGFEVTALLGDYQGGPWDERADAWIILAKKRTAPATNRVTDQKDATKSRTPRNSLW